MKILFSVDEEVLVIAGGYDGREILSNVEVYSPDGKCNFELPPLPKPNYGGNIFMLNEKLYVCGGNLGNSQNCHYLDERKNEWIYNQQYSFHEPRHMASYSVSEDGIIFVR